MTIQAPIYSETFVFDTDIQGEGLYPKSFESDRLSPINGPNIFCHDIMEHCFSPNNNHFEGLTEEWLAFGIIFGVRIYATNMNPFQHGNYKWDAKNTSEWLTFIEDELIGDASFDMNNVFKKVAFDPEYNSYYKEWSDADMPTIFSTYPVWLARDIVENTDMLRDYLLDYEEEEKCEFITSINNWWLNTENIDYLTKLMGYSWWLFFYKYDLNAYKFASLWEQLYAWYDKDFDIEDSDIEGFKEYGHNHATLDIKLDWNTYTINIVQDFGMYELEDEETGEYTEVEHCLNKSWTIEA